MRRMKQVAVILAAALGAERAIAGPYGYDIHNTLMPASGAMAGTSLASPQDAPSAVFGNPATLTQFPGTQFSFGATFYQPVVEVTHDGSVTGAAFSARSGTDVFPVPNVAVTQDLNGLGLPATLGLGLTVVSGIGAEFKDEPRSLGASAELVVLGVNMGAGFRVADGTSLGATMTISYASLDAGLTSAAALVHDIGVRGTIGASQDLGESSRLGVFYQTELTHNFDNLFQVRVDTSGLPVFTDQTVSQPANLGIGLANSSLLDGRLLLSADLLYKLWSDSAFWQDVYHNQLAFSLGAQLTRGPWRWRLGYGWAEDPNRDVPVSLGTLISIRAGLPGITIPVTTPVIQYLQATQTEVIYQHRLTGGVGYRDLLPGLDLDLHFGWQFKESRIFGGHTRADVHSFHGGFALTWRFD
ncbi:MAG: outer membrane protein transport protein [Gammaproteobacteria bacterium]|nr:outer membrane protein transport protein [Gammaproteobacteria bacterium]